MPRVSKSQARENRDAIEVASARLFRERGLDGVSVADLMAAAGLTHGGFYGHFASKDALAGVACGRAFDEALGRWDARASRADTPEGQRAAIIRGYLTPAHRDNPGAGCAAAALATDMAREPHDRPVRQAYAAGIEALVGRLAALNAGDDGAARQEALVQLSAMVGAMVLARATQGEPLSDEFLAAARDALAGELA